MYTMCITCYITCDTIYTIDAELKQAYYPYYSYDYHSHIHIYVQKLHHMHRHSISVTYICIHIHTFHTTWYIYNTCVHIA